MENSSTIGNYDIDSNGYLTTTNLVYESKEYRKILKKKQKEHLDNVYNRNENNFEPCLHDSCLECVGTGIKKDGSPCVHYISCSCPKCKLRY